MALVHVRGFSPQVFSESIWYTWLEPALSVIRALDASQGFPAPEVWSALHREIADAVSVPKLTFVPSPAKKPKRRRRREPIQLTDLYEGKVAELHEVPTRLDDWHDLFNALAFISFPRAKWALHNRQFVRMRERISPTTRRLPGARTREQDALSLLDEGGLVVAVPEAMFGDAPSDFDAFERWMLDLHRAGTAQAVPFGHALFEHLVLGRDDMAGTVVLLPVPSMPRSAVELRGMLDSLLAERLSCPSEFMEPSRARGLTLSQLTP